MKGGHVEGRLCIDARSATDGADATHGAASGEAIAAHGCIEKAMTRGGVVTVETEGACRAGGAAGGLAGLTGARGFCALQL